MKKVYLLLLLLLLTTIGVSAQSRNKQLTIEVQSVEGDDLTGQPLTLMQTDYEVSYGQLKLDGNGRCQLKVYGGNHQLTIEREGFDVLTHDFAIDEAETEVTVSVTLIEKTRQPYALTATCRHDAFSGKNDIYLSWNTEAPAFFDDFESYEPFAIEFGEWTGIDGDQEAAAPLLGSYPNRGTMQYAQIINPLTVQPTWWYDYPILRPYDGQQYVGFTRTSSGNQNDDWLISPIITVGTDNVLQFMGKAADQFPERFMVYVTTTLDQPTQADFVRIDKDNYETADYRGWQQFSYDLAAYAGQQIRFAIRYISDYNRYRSFMLMIDNVYVGQDNAQLSALNSQISILKSLRSPANANETFHLLLDGEQVGTTDGYSYVIENVSSGDHLVGVQAVYLQAMSDVTTTTVTVAPAEAFSQVVFNVTAQSLLSADGQQLSLLSMETAESYLFTVADGKAVVPSLPNGQYVVNMAQGAFEAYQQTITIDGDTTIDIVLSDYLLAPYNITATEGDDGRLTLRWNQELIFNDSFETYDDFATGNFGDWLTIDNDHQPVYPIALGSASNIVSFPGSGTGTNPTAIAPMVFNPWSTTPPMLPTDPAIAAPTGNKSVIFFSPQRVQADKWLISPLLDIHDAYQLTVTAKGYSSMYPESMEFCISEGSTQIGDFTTISEVSPVSSEQWTRYVTDLSGYAGQTVRLAVHYTSVDAFLTQVDDFTVGPEDGQGETVDYGNVVRFDIYLDGEKIGESTSPQYVLGTVTPGYHVVGIVAIYLNGQSEMTEYTIGNTVGIATVACRPAPTAQQATLYDLGGRRLSNAPAHGIYLIHKNNQIIKMAK